MSIHQGRQSVETKPTISIKAQMQELKRLRDLVRKAEQPTQEALLKRRKRAAN